MKCLSCDCILSDKEAVRKSLRTGKFIDLCDDCFRFVANEIPTVEGFDFPEEDNGEDA